MKLSFLLAQRPALLQQVRLANLAHTYERLREIAVRIARAKLSGEVRLQQVAPEDERYEALLIASEGSQSVIEEHFTDEDLMELAEGLAFLTGETDLDLLFRLEDLEGRFLAPLRGELEKAGVVIERRPNPVGDLSGRGSARPQ